MDKARKVRKASKAHHTLEGMIGATEAHFQGILRKNLYEMDVSREYLEELIKRKQELRKKLRDCFTGNKEAKESIKEYIREMLLEKYQLNDSAIQEILPFENPGRLTVTDKFDILLYCGKKQYGARALEQLILGQGMLQYENGQYCITRRQVEQAFQKQRVYLDFTDKLEILAQKIYQQYKGLGVIDELRDMRLDGVSAGVSGEGDPLTVWILFQGKNVQLSFLQFPSVGELERVCRNICRYNSPGQLSESRGYLINEMADRSRVVVARPPFSENWVFFVRKFDNLERITLEELLVDEGREIPAMVLKWIVKGCQVCAVTGVQGSGKTTLLKAMVGLIPREYTLRVLETNFELNLKALYPDRNILTFQESESIDGREILDLQKKTDGTVSIIGEISNERVASWMIESGQTGFLFTMFTHHAKTTRSLVLTLRNSLLSEGSFQNEAIAREQVTDVVKFDIHMHKDRDGHRYIERITEIVGGGPGGSYEENEMVSYVDGRYQLNGPFSKQGIKSIKSALTKEEREEFDQEFHLPPVGT